MSDSQKDYTLIDVFTSQRFSGNPAVVFLDGAELNPAVMQKIAAEMNVSETAFLLPVEPGSANDYRLRWFTPTCEVGMCLHATLATVWSLAQQERIPAAVGADPTPLRIETRGGVLRAFVSEQGSVWVNAIEPHRTPMTVEAAELATLLGGSAEMWTDQPSAVRTQDGDLIVFVRDALSLQGLMPKFDALADYCRQQALRGVCVSTLSTLDPSMTLQSRFFAPAVGVPEDPVTGSVHAPLAVHLVAEGLVPMNDGLAILACVQSTPVGRAGLVHALVQQIEEGSLGVHIGAQCVPVARGVLYL